MALKSEATSTEGVFNSSADGPRSLQKEVQRPEWGATSGSAASSVPDIESRQSRDVATTYAHTWRDSDSYSDWKATTDSATMAGTFVHQPLREPGRAHTNVGPSELAIQVLRSRFMSDILADLKQIQNHCREPLSSVYAAGLMENMRAMRDLSPVDPTLQAVMALHDAMAYKERWADYNPEQYEGAYKILKKLSGIERPNKNVVEKAMADLENLGFDTLPFEIDFPEGDADAV